MNMDPTIIYLSIDEQRENLVSVLSTYNQLEKIEFGNGTFWTRAEINADAASAPWH